MLQRLTSSFQFDSGVVLLIADESEDETLAVGAECSVGLVTRHNCNRRLLILHDRR